MGRFVFTARSADSSRNEYALTTNTTSFKINAPGPGVIVLTEPYIDGDFQVRVNGRLDHYFRVNSAFRGLFVSPEASTPSRFPMAAAFDDVVVDFRSSIDRSFPLAGN